MPRPACLIKVSMLTFSLVVSLGAVSSAAGREAPAGAVGTDGYTKGKDIILNITTSEDGQFIGVGIVETSDGPAVAPAGYSGEETGHSTTRAYPERQTSKQFTHQIISSDNVVVATFYVTVTGVYSEIDREANITDVTVFLRVPGRAPFRIASPTAAIRRASMSTLMDYPF